MKIGINGGGIGGLAAAIALRKAGHDVEVYEQARDYARVGADINLTPNAVRALKSLGVFEALEGNRGSADVPHQPHMGHRRGDFAARNGGRGRAEIRRAAADHPPRRSC